MMNRIKHEIELIKKEKSDYHFIYYIPPNYNSINQNINITFHLIKEFFDIMIIIEKKYPFVPPTILFNYKSLPHIYINDYNFECLKCNSYLCSNNWYPAIKIVQLIDDVEKLIGAKYKKNASYGLEYFKNIPKDIKKNIISFV